jgi:hypothetical protein
VVGFSLELNTFQYSCSSLESAFVFQSFTPMGVFIDGCVYYVFVCLVCLCVDTHTHTQNTHIHTCTHTHKGVAAREVSTTRLQGSVGGRACSCQQQTICASTCARAWQAHACLLCVRARAHSRTRLHAHAQVDQKFAHAHDAQWLKVRPGDLPIQRVGVACRVTVFAV